MSAVTGCSVCGALLLDNTARRTARCSRLDAAHRQARDDAHGGQQ